jgi:hypothetical protein
MLLQEKGGSSKGVPCYTNPSVCANDQGKGAATIMLLQEKGGSSKGVPCHTNPSVCASDQGKGAATVMLLQEKGGSSKGVPCHTNLSVCANDQGKGAATVMLLQEKGGSSKGVPCHINPSVCANDQEKGAATALLSLAQNREPSDLSGSSRSSSESQGGSDCKEKTDNRGRHWKDKVLQGCPPEPWKHTKDWAERRTAKESEFCELLRLRGMSYTLPWRRSQYPHRSMGNTNKVLFMELLVHHLNGVAVLTFVEENMCFLGIQTVCVKPEYRSAFDAGLIPSVDGKRRVDGFGAHIKTLVKIWHTAGFVERVLEGGALNYVFDQATFDRMKAQAQRADKKRRRASKVLPTDPSSPVDSRPDSLEKESMGRLSVASPRTACAAGSTSIIDNSCYLAQKFGGIIATTLINSSGACLHGGGSGRDLGSSSGARSAAQGAGPSDPSHSTPQPIPVPALLAAHKDSDDRVPRDTLLSGAGVKRDRSLSPCAGRECSRPCQSAQGPKDAVAAAGSESTGAAAALMEAEVVERRAADLEALGVATSLLAEAVR